MSTSVLAAGCTMSSSFMMVAPSFEMVTPCSSMIRLLRHQNVVQGDMGSGVQCKPQPVMQGNMGVC